MHDDYIMVGKIERWQNLYGVLVVQIGKLVNWLRLSPESDHPEWAYRRAGVDQTVLKDG